MVARFQSLIALFATIVSVSACGGDHPPSHHKRAVSFEKRQATATYPSGPAYDVPPLASISPTPPTYTDNELPVIATYAPGSQPPLSGAPPLPAYTIVPTAWPNLTATPPTDSPEVQQWLKELEGHNIPTYSPNHSVECDVPENAAALAAAGGGDGGRCWWTCGPCLRETDMSQCKDEWDWGHTYDDGPGFYTNKLLTYLNSLPPNSDIPTGVAPGIKATFFLVGAWVISRPEIVVYEYMNNHEISIHTWSHTALTTLTNEQIVAELGWTRKAIKDITGVTPLNFRPPYGDVDDRVRAIALAMGMRPVIWTSSSVGAVQWDSQDWRVHGGDVQAVANQASLETILDSSPQFSDPTSPSYSTAHQGVIVLQHDIYIESVNLAIGYTVPYAQNHNPQWKLKTVTECQPRSDGNGKQSLNDAYVETNTDLGNPAWLAIHGGNSSATQSTTSTSSYVSTTRATRILSSSSSSSAPNTSSAPSSAPPNIGIIAGAAVAGGLALIIVVIGAVLLLRRKKPAKSVY